MAPAGALCLDRHDFNTVSQPLCLLAIALVAWYGGIGPAALAVVLSSLANDYYFIPPLYSLTITRNDVPHFVIFIVVALLLSWFASVRRRAERALLQSREELKREVAERTQQASLLNLTHDTIFIRDMSDIITYWNRGAQELYGWTPEEAIGKQAHELLQTVFPVPIDSIREELLDSGRWEGEVEKTKSDGTRVVVASRWSLRRDDQMRPAAILETKMTSLSESGESRKFACSMKTSKNEAMNLPRSTRNWKHSLIRYRMTSAHPSGTWSDSRNSCKKMPLPS